MRDDRGVEQLLSHRLTEHAVLRQPVLDVVQRDRATHTLNTAPRKLVTTEPDVFVDLVVVVGVNVDFDGDGKVDVAGER